MASYYGEHNFPAFSSKYTNVQGGQFGIYSSAVNSSDSGNTSFVKYPVGGPSDAPAVRSATRPTEASPTQRSTRAIPKSPASQPPTMISDIVGQSAPVTCDTYCPKTPARGLRDTSKGYAFQFGSSSPVFMNGMQIPARTSSAPPNLDEQKHDLARHDTSRSLPCLPTPAPKPQLPRKDTTAAHQSNIGETHLPKTKKDTRVSPALPVGQTQKPSAHSYPMTSVQMPYYPPQVSVQFGGPNPQVQFQGVTASSLPMGMPMALSMGNAPQMWQPLYVQGLLSHPMQPQGIMHQARGSGFPTAMGPQLPPQFGNLGISITSQYPQQQAGKFGGPRKTPVKITDPKKHEELRLDKRAETYADSELGSTGTHGKARSS